MIQERRWQDKYGSYHLIANDHFIESVIIGAVGDSITDRFSKDICDLALLYNGKPFGYFADLSASEGYTEEAEKDIVRSYLRCLELGCVIDAMKITSPLVKAQMQRVSDIVDIDIPLEVRLFNSRDEGVAFVEKIVLKAIDRMD